MTKSRIVQDIVIPDGEPRGTLTLAPDDIYVVGLPHGRSHEEATQAARLVRTFLDSDHHVLVFPWPVDVTDLRRPR